MRAASIMAMGFLAAVGGCGAGGPEGNVARFVGSWTAVSGTYDEPCDNGSDDKGPLTGTFTLAAGSTSDLVTVSSGGICSAKLNVEGLVATYVPEVCGIEEGLAGSTFTLHADGRLADLISSERLHYPATTCLSVDQGTYQKD